MSKKKDSPSGQLVAMLASTGAVFVLRKVLDIVWTKITGKQPPIDLADPGVTLPEAVGWAVTLAAVVEIARFGIIRAATRRAAPDAPEAEAD